MSGSPKHLEDVHPVTWLAFIALLTTVFYVLPIWVAEYAVLASVLGLIALSEDQRRAKTQRIRKALEMCGYSLTTAARTANMDIADFSRMLTGERTLDDWRLEMLGDEFMRTLALLELQDRGLPEFARMAIQIQPALHPVKEQAS